MQGFFFYVQKDTEYKKRTADCSSSCDWGRRGNGEKKKRAMGFFDVGFDNLRILPLRIGDGHQLTKRRLDGFVQARKSHKKVSKMRSSLFATKNEVDRMLQN
jgi:hypothetical protein